MEVRTHRAIEPELCGRVLSLGEGRATVELLTTDVMTVDDHQLIHGGFIFGLADHAAMVAVNAPTVVLAAAQVRFTLPVVVGDRLLAEAVVAGDNRRVGVTVSRGDDVVMTGEFSCRVLDRHVLER